MDKYNFFHQGGPRPTEGQRLDTKLLYRNSNEVYARFDDWKDIDKFYFIPLYLEMTYSCGCVAVVVFHLPLIDCRIRLESMITE